MSDNVVGQNPETQQPTRDAASEVVKFFASDTVRSFQPRLRSVSGTCRFDIAGAGRWLVRIQDGTPTITSDVSADTPADCVLACSANDFLRIAHREGYMNVLAAFLQGIVTITGDIAFATSLLGGVTVNTVGSAATQS